MGMKESTPVKGETTKAFENTAYYCPKHKSWTLHKPSECRLGESFNNTFWETPL